MTRINVYVWFENLYLPPYLRISTFPPGPSSLNLSHDSPDRSPVNKPGLTPAASRGAGQQTGSLKTAL